jgi:endoribonuclease Dicer
MEVFKNIHLNESNSAKFHSIVFVDQIVIAFYLNHLMQTLSSNNNQWNFLKTDYIVGSNQKDNNTITMNIHEQAKVIDRFREFKINILIATNIVEEGVDIPSCNTVIRFSKIHNFGSYIQSKGRTRSKNSTFFIMLDTADCLKGEEEVFNFLLIERELQTNILETIKFDNDISDDNESNYDLDPVDINNIPLLPYEKNGCKITPHTAIDLLQRYCSTLDSQSLVCSLYAIYDFDSILIDTDKYYFKCTVWLPPNSIYHQKVESGVFRSKKLAKMSAALKMCIQLDKLGQFTENLTISTQEDWLKPHCDINDNESDDKMKKIGSKKNQRDYETVICDEFKIDDSIEANSGFVYSIEIEESVVYPDDNYPQLLSDDNNNKLGFLSTKSFEEVNFNFQNFF